jgi:hypothetical protein
MSSRVVLTTLASCLVLLTLAGCGLEGQSFMSDKEEKAEVLSDQAVITPDDLADAPEDTARGLVLRWWRAVQTRDPQGVIKSYVPEARDQLPKRFADAVVVGIAPPAAESTLNLSYLEHADDGVATVYMTIYSPDPRIDGPLALPLKKIDGEWRIIDAAFLGTLATSYLAAAEEESAAPADRDQ